MEDSWVKGGTKYIRVDGRWKRESKAQCNLLVE
jgi:hypothetical protein